MRGALLVATLAAAGIAGAACSGSGGGGGTLDGLVVAAQNGAPIPGATVEVLGARTFTSDAQGRFGPTGVGAGGYGMVARKDGFHTLQSNVVVEDGDNHLHVEMIECLQPFDAAPGCTPTGTNTPVPRATPNAFVRFDGVNLANDNTVDPWNGGGGRVIDSTGADVLIGDGSYTNGDAIFDPALSECWINPGDSLNAGDGNRTLSTDNLVDVDHCLIRWYGEGDAITAGLDAMLELRVRDDAATGATNEMETLWVNGSRLDVAHPLVEFIYFEGVINGNASFTPTGTYVATTGSILLIDAGFYNDGSNASLVITSAAGFVIPTMP